MSRFVTRMWSLPSVIAGLAPTVFDQTWNDDDYWLLHSFGSNDNTTFFALLAPGEEDLDRGRFARFTHEPCQYRFALSLCVSRFVERSALLNEIFDWIGERDSRWSMCLETEKRLSLHQNVLLFFSFDSSAVATEFALRWSDTDLP